jgi:hypothetical protein
MDLGSIRMELQHQKEWEKSPISDSLLALFSDFSQDDLTFFQATQNDSIVSYNFVQDDYTVIIDLSTLREVNKKLFLAFVILAKIIHYINSEKNYTKKFIVMPYVDVFFDSYYLDNKRNYDRVDLFLKPLIEHDFGLIFSANQTRYLHSNFLLFFNNFITLRAWDNRDIGILRSLMNLQELHGTGYYSSKRNNTYQLGYLQNMKDNEVLIRRDDIDQPFPAYIEWEKVINNSMMSYESIVEYMKTHGFDLQFNERKILERAKKTLFEIDLGHYFIYVKEIIKFLNELTGIDQIGNLYKHKLQTQLKELLYPKLSKKSMKKKNMKKVRDELLEVLIKQGYLVENHPRRAGGSEALRTSYSVGTRYQQALDDYFETKGKAQSEINVEILEKATKRTQDLTNVFGEGQRKYIIQENKLRNALMRELSEFNYEIFTIYSYLNHQDFENTIKVGHGLIKSYLKNVYRQYFNVDTVIIDELNSFLAFIGEAKGFPFSKQILNEFIDKYQNLNLERVDIESLAREIYQFIYEFFTKIQHYIYKETNNNE